MMFGLISIAIMVTEPELPLRDQENHVHIKQKASIKSKLLDSVIILSFHDVIIYIVHI